MDTILKELNLDKAMTREDAASNREVIAKLVAAGPKAVEHLVNRLADNGDPTAQVALHAMAFAVGAPGKEEQLKGFVDSLAAQLQRDLPQGTKYFLIEQLQLTGGRQAVPAIAANLGEDALADAASRALTRIGGPNAAAALREALPKAKGRARLSIMQALTDLGDRQALDEFRKTAKDENRDARVLALFCLADLGDADSIDLVLGSVDGKPRFERMQNFRAALRLGQRLKEAGKASEAKRVFQEVLKRCTGDHDSHVKQAAARGLLTLAGGAKMNSGNTLSNWRTRWSLVILQFLCAIAAFAATDQPPAPTQPHVPVVDAQYPGGNIKVAKSDNDEISVGSDSRDSNWDLYWNFRVRRASGHTLNIHVTRGFMGPFGPAVSTDAGLTWNWAGAQAMSKSVLTYTVPTGVEEVRFASTIPYTETQLQSFLKKYQGHPNLRQGVLTRTEKKRDAIELYLGRIDGQAPTAVFLFARQHSCETIGSYVLEGIMEAVLAKGADGDWFRDKVEFRVVPFIDYDGVEDGDQGKSRRPHDHARDFLAEPLYATTRAIKTSLATWSRGRLRLTMNFHCPTGERHIFSVEGPDEESSVLGRPLMDHIQRLQRGPLRFETKGTVHFGQGWNNYRGPGTFRNLTMTLPDKPVRALLEIPYAAVGKTPVTADAARAFGADIARGMRPFLETNLPAVCGRHD